MMLAPSIILVEAWQSPEFKSFYTSIFNNLFEDTDEEKKILEQHTTIVQQAEQVPPLMHLSEIFGYTREKWNSVKYHFRWNITEKEI